jgi:penicillin-binding protein 1A
MERTDAQAPAGSAGRGFRRILRRLASRRMVLLLLFLFGSGWLLWARCGVRGCPPVERLAAYRPDGAPVLLDRTGEPFALLAPVERRMVHLDSLPAHVPAAFLSVEDRRFFAHGGIDWIRVGGALLANLRAGRTVQGSSTITMQLARNVFADRLPARQRTWRRKLLEARVARQIEARFTKAEILELYLNHIYFGNGAYGVEAAARHYFDRPAARLTVDQAAVLAALPKASARAAGSRAGADGAAGRAGRRRGP